MALQREYAQSASSPSCFVASSMIEVVHRDYDQEMVRMTTIDLVALLARRVSLVPQALTHPGAIVSCDGVVPASLAIS
jgi:hypothetical protein